MNHITETEVRQRLSACPPDEYGIRKALIPVEAGSTCWNPLRKTQVDQDIQGWAGYTQHAAGGIEYRFYTNLPAPRPLTLVGWGKHRGAEHTDRPTVGKRRLYLDAGV